MHVAAHVAALIQDLRLVPHPEGGFYRETYRSARLDHTGRSAGTMIYFLLPAGHVSRLHRIDADEGWHLYLGGPLEIYELDARRASSHRTTLLGTDLAQGEVPQHVVDAGTWFGAALAPGAEFALVGCTVAPGFEFARFELGVHDELVRIFPAGRDLIARLT